MKQQQEKNMISRIYEQLGSGIPPVSAGKFELKKRQKLF